MKPRNIRSSGLENLTRVERDVPKPGPNEVVVQFHAASLNYRDLLFARGLYNPRPRLPAIPLSDGAGEIIALGEGVTRWKPGDRVCPLFMQGWIDGPLTSAKSRTALGAGDLDGVLRERGVFHEEGLVRIPDHLSDPEAATLPCAAVTAWTPWFMPAKSRRRDGSHPRHRRRFDLRPAIRENARSTRHRHVEQRRQTGAGSRAGSGRDDQL